QGGGPAAFVGAHHLAHARALAYRPRRGRATLVLGDQRGARPRERLAERPALSARGRVELDLGQRPPVLPLLDAVVRGRDQLLEPHAHAGASSLVRSTKRSIVSRAAPESIARSAARAPSGSEAAA